MFAIPVLVVVIFRLLFYGTPGQIAQAAGAHLSQGQLAAGLTLAYTSNVTTATFHDVITYQVSIRNSNLVTATGLDLTALLPFPGETTYLTGTVAASRGNAAYDIEEHAIRWAGAVPAQGSALITFAIQLTKFTTCETLYSHALLQAPSLPAPLSTFAKVEYRCPQIKELQFTVRGSVTQTAPGGMIDYQLTLTNASDLPADQTQVINPIPLSAAYVTGSATATNGIFTYDPIFKELSWAATLPERSTTQISFQARVRDRVRCGTIINNQATVYNTYLMQPSKPTIEVQTTVTCTESLPWSDFGDAPDSDSNHHGLNNTAYADTGVLGHFPTVWEGTPPTEASGPTHRPDRFWLGDQMSTEVDADLDLDASHIASGYDFTNILHNGREDVANGDWEDDGWLNPNVPMLHCETTTIVVRIRRSNLPTPVDRLWLNVWFDGNRDGDWQDSGDCPGLIDSLQVKSFEWLVQDWAIDTTQIPQDSYLDLKIPTKLVYNLAPTSAAWLRVTLSERPALRPTAGGLADGRGPAYPALFQVGETEDYLIEALPSEEPISVRATHQIESAIAESIRLGDEIYVSTFLSATAGVAPATVVMSHNIPAEVTLTRQPELHAIYLFYGSSFYDDGATPLDVIYQPNIGGNGQLGWRGQLIRNALVWVYYEAKVNACPPPDENGQPMLRSAVQMRQPDGTLVNTEATYPINCAPTGIAPRRLFLPLVKE